MLIMPPRINSSKERLCVELFWCGHKVPRVRLRTAFYHFRTEFLDNYRNRGRQELPLVKERLLPEYALLGNGQEASLPIPINNRPAERSV
jgi:hypothetical protein